jgi:signal transduction histidine kinase
VRHHGDTSRGDPATPPEAEPGRRVIAFGITVFRFASFIVMVALASLATRTWTPGMVGLLLVVGCWILIVSRAGAWERPWVRWADLVLSLGALLLGPLLLAQGEVGRRPFFAAPYALSTVMTWAASRGVTGGVLAAVVLSIPLAVNRPLNGTPWNRLDSGEILDVVTGIAYYLLAGFVVGLFTEALHRAAGNLRAVTEEAAREREQAARLRERETLARTIHDSVLQSLALVHRRGQELSSGRLVEPDDVAELVGLVDRQERELRALLRRSPDEPPAGAVPLRTALEAGAFGITGVEVSVSTVEPAWIGASAASELSAVVRAALDNVAQHASASRATIFGEADGTHLVVSIRDDGVGFEVASVRDERTGHFGIARSIRGRVEDLGGQVRIESAPGRGTQLEIRVPAFDGGSV